MIFLLSTYLYLDKTDLAFGHIITFLSIIAGFCITALSIISTSNFAKELYKIEDPHDNSKTLLHNLTDTFKNCILSSSIAIVLILINFYFSNLGFCKLEFLGTWISVKSVIIGGIWYFTIVSIIVFIRLVFLFSKFVIQSAKRQ
jgi:hypothetical protein